MTEELESYQFQLDQVNEAIEKDPDNTELQKLKDDLLQLVNLLKSSTEVSSSENSKQSTENSSKHHSNVSSPSEISSSKSYNKKKQHEKGDIVMAKWSVDKQYYEATILNVISPTSYQIVFNGYGNEEVVNDTDIKEIASKAEPAAATAATTHDTNNRKRPYATIVAAPSTELTNPHAVDTERKKKIKKKKEANINKKEQEQVKKQKAWNSFAKSNSKILKNNSIFKTPTEYNGKVGFSGSGRPMTKFSERKKHIY